MESNCKYLLLKHYFKLDESVDGEAIWVTEPLNYDLSNEQRSEVMSSIYIFRAKGVTIILKMFKNVLAHLERNWL